MPAESELLDALKEVIDPELMVNIVDLGLIYEVTPPVEEGGEAKVLMSLTSPACPAGPQLVSNARSAVERVEGVGSCDVTLTMDPPWEPDRMTDDARDQLGIF